MTMKDVLVRIATVVANEAAQNVEFRERLEKAMGMSRATAAHQSSIPDVTSAGGRMTSEKRRGGRRSPAIVDPIALVADGETALRDKLMPLDLELLYDIVAQYGMDPGKLVMKWRDKDRVIDRIVEVAQGRATKGDAFRKQ